MNSLRDTLFELSAGSGGSAVPTGVASPPAPTPSACLPNLPTPTALSTPARDLTRREARDICVYLVGQGAFTLSTRHSPLRFDATCQITQPRPASRLVIDPAVISGVRFVNRSNRRVDFLDNLDVRIVVALYRLASMLRGTWGTTEIEHLGIGHGKGPPTDVHNTGRAIDLVGVVGTISGSSDPTLNGPYQLDVLRDWGNQPVTMPDGRIRSQWPASFTATTYRLQPRPNFLAFAIFRDIYTFATRECADTSTDRNGNTASPTTIGGQRTFIIHPDHRSGTLREAHKNHFHMQVGPTDQEVSPP
jgi:hypothetical protein